MNAPTRGSSWAESPAAPMLELCAFALDPHAMDAERLNQIAATLDDLARRAGELRGFL